MSDEALEDFDLLQIPVWLLQSSLAVASSSARVIQNASSVAVSDIEVNISAHVNGKEALHAAAFSRAITAFHSLKAMLWWQACGEPPLEPCVWDPHTEAVHLVALLVVLGAAILGVVIFLSNFREEKEHCITPLCPQLVVQSADFNFLLLMDDKSDTITATDGKGQPICKLALEWPDDFRGGTSSVAATARLSTAADVSLCTVIVRNVAMSGQGIALCRPGCEVFGFVEPVPGRNAYEVRHRSGVHLLTVFGDFGAGDVTFENTLGAKVAWFEGSGGSYQAGVVASVDCGMVLCCLVATHLHRKVMSFPASDLQPLPLSYALSDTKEAPDAD